MPNIPEHATSRVVKNISRTKMALTAPVVRVQWCAVELNLKSPCLVLETKVLVLVLVLVLVSFSCEVLVLVLVLVLQVLVLILVFVNITAKHLYYECDCNALELLHM